MENGWVIFLKKRSFLIFGKIKVMVKKEKEGIPRQAWLRVGLLVLVVGSLLWIFTTQAKAPDGGQVVGEKVNLDFFPDEVSDGFQVLGEKIKEVIPKETQEEIITTVEKNQIVEEIKKTVTIITEEVEGFPQKQEKELKKQVIQEVCNQLLEDLESE